jgi:tRNA (guanine37-N1)-methyltransferase
MEKARFPAKRSRICSSTLAFGSGLSPKTAPLHPRLSRLEFVTLFPAMFDGPMTESLVGRARERRLIDVRVHNLRDWSAGDRHRTVDDRPYGGGPGMVIQAEPIFRALQALKAEGAKVFGKKVRPYVVLMSPQGRVLKQSVAQHLSRRPWVILLCAHYEGVDERILRWVDEEISIGDYVLTGGELPAMVLADAALRLVPGVVKEAGSIVEESFQNGRLDYPHFTRPAVWKGIQVPPVLLSGDHAAIERWRAQAALKATRRKRPDLLRGLSSRRKR